MSFLIEDDTLVRAIATTLLHTLWQGLLIAGVLAAMLHAMRNAPANVRYLVSCGAMLILVASALATFAVLTQPVDAKQTLAATPRAARPMDAVSGPSLDDSATPFALSPNEVDPLRYLVTAWLVGVSTLALWHAGGWITVLRLRRGCAQDALQPLVDRLATRMSLRRAVRVIESAAAEVPAVIGALRPVIVVPVAMLSELSPPHVEAILAHELAHVRRHDYLINLLQCAAETLLFYHPATWWISSRIRCERENSADDVAATVCGDRRGYAAALAALEASRPMSIPPRFAPAATHGDLLDRVRRVLRLPPTPQRISPIRSLAAAVIAVACVAVPLACTAQDKPATPSAAPTTAPSPSVAAAPTTRPDALRITNEAPPGDKQFVEVVIAMSGLHHANKFIDIDTLRGQIAAMPEADRRRTVLVVKADSPDVTVGHFFQQQAALHRLVQEQHLAYLSEAGITDAGVRAAERAASVRAGDARIAELRARLGKAKAQYGADDPRVKDAQLLLQQHEYRVNLERELDKQLATTRPARPAAARSPPAKADAASALPPGTEVGEFYMDGLVPRPGVYSLTGRRINVKQAIAAAGGLNPGATDANVSVLRRAADDSEHYELENVPAADILSGRHKDLILRTNEIVRIRAGGSATTASAAPATQPGAVGDVEADTLRLLEQRSQVNAAMDRYAARLGDAHRSTQAMRELLARMDQTLADRGVAIPSDTNAGEPNDSIDLEHALQKARLIVASDWTMREYFETLGQMEFNLKRLARNVGPKSRIYLDAEADIDLQRRRIVEYSASYRRVNANPVATTSPATSPATPR